MIELCGFIFATHSVMLNAFISMVCIIFTLFAAMGVSLMVNFQL